MFQLPNLNLIILIGFKLFFFSSPFLIYHYCYWIKNILLKYSARWRMKKNWTFFARTHTKAMGPHKFKNNVTGYVTGFSFQTVRKTTLCVQKEGFFALACLLHLLLLCVCVRALRTNTLDYNIQNKLLRRPKQQKSCSRNARGKKKWMKNNTEQTKFILNASAWAR